MLHVDAATVSVPVLETDTTAVVQLTTVLSVHSLVQNVSSAIGNYNAMPESVRS